jgi:two-component system, OmpR family, KDP operon response regulator KdpE
MTTARILVVDDEPQILRFLKPSLAAAGYDVLTAATATEALKLATANAPDLILLDLGLPDLDGKEVIARLRGWSSVPIIVVSARDREVEKIAALDLGADDYVDKPFAIGELLARLRAALRHAGRKVDDRSTIAVGDIVIDLAAHSVTCGGEPVRLTPKEFEVLTILARHAGRVMTHVQILTAVWGPAHTHDVQYLRVVIGQIRQKLARPGHGPEVIRTEPGIGYRLDDTN